MCRPQCLLALVALYVGLAHSWDIAVGVGNQLIFYTDGTKTNTVNFISRNVVALAYDQVHDRMLYVDKQSNYDAICSYNLHSKENKCFIERTGGNIHSIAFDPATQTLFFTDTNDNSINSISLKSGSVNNVKVNLVIKMNDRTPRDIAVDSCTGYIYWIKTSNKNMGGLAEKARFNGSERKVMPLMYEVVTLGIDPLTQRMYFFGTSDYYTNYFGINRRCNLIKTDLDGKYNAYSKYKCDAEHYPVPEELTISKDYLYWVNSSENHTTVWQLPKHDKEPNEISTFYTGKQPAIATNYKIEDQIQGRQNCEALSSLISTITVTNNSLNIEQTTEYTTDVELFCDHGVHVREKSVCNCTRGYIGERCDVSVCHNYCLQGNCSLNNEGLPACSCDAGYTGERCEVNVCYGYCSNNGTCSLNENSEPVCECKGDYVGDRCEVSDCLNYCMQGNCSVNDDGLPTCRCDAGYSGKRCELYACHGYCWNDGVCSLNEEDEPVCQCAANHEGSRCKTDTSDTATDTPTYDLAKINLTLVDLLSRLGKPTSKMFLVVEVPIR